MDDPKDETNEPKGYEKHLQEYHEVQSKVDGNIHMDNIFSYWIYLWFIVYLFSSFSSSKSPFNKYVLQNWNPLLALILALIENVSVLGYLLYIWPDTATVLKYVAMMIFVKILPIYELRNTKINWKSDIINVLLVFGIYNLYLALKGTTFLEVYNETYKTITNNKNKTPLFYTINKFMTWFSQKTGYPLPHYIRELSEI